MSVPLSMFLKRPPCSPCPPAPRDLGALPVLALRFQPIRAEVMIPSRTLFAAVMLATTVAVGGDYQLKTPKILPVEAYPARSTSGGITVAADPYPTDEKSFTAFDVHDRLHDSPNMFFHLGDTLFARKVSTGLRGLRVGAGTSARTAGRTSGST